MNSELWGLEVGLRHSDTRLKDMLSLLTPTSEHTLTLHVSMRAWSASLK